MKDVLELLALTRTSVARALLKRREKVVEILIRSADLARAMGGGRVTSCKSAKDRTAMSVTLELARVLRLYGLQAADVMGVANRMRR